MQDTEIVVEIDQDLADLVPHFLESRRADISVMRAALAAGDFDTLRMMGHDFKGTGGGYGFDAITDIGRTLEEAAIARQVTDIEKAIDAVALYLKRVRVVYV